MGEPNGPDEAHTLRGPIDRAVLVAIRDLVDEHEPLGSATLDDFIDPRVLEVRLADELGDAESARIDVQWTTQGDYAFHYTDSAGIDCRWDSHLHAGTYSSVSGEAHFHPPPDASSEPSDVEVSCIGHTRPLLVTRAVLKLWRTAYHTGSLAALNAGSNPP